MDFTRVHHKEEPITLLYEAAISGSTTTLETLMHKDKLILNKVSLSPFTETPLHISALLGHLDFTIAILEKCPKMAFERDSLKRLPLHLAAAEGHAQIVKALLNIDKSSCLARDAEGRIPLHLAVIRGRADVTQELVAANSESFCEVLDGDTVFHLCVKHNHLEVFKLLVKLIDNYEIINLGNQDGNSVLHLAAMLKQLETLRYLLSLSKIKAEANSINGKGKTALDLLDEWPKDFKTLQIQDFLINEGLTRAVKIEVVDNNNFQPNVQQKKPPTTIAVISSTESKAKKNLIQNLEEHLDYDAKKIRGSIMIVATVIATMSFTAAMNPPGGVWQEDHTDGNKIKRCNATHICEAGTSVLASLSPGRYDMYVSFNNIAFVISLSIVASMVGGFPLKKKRYVWFFAIAINVTVVFLSLGYIFGVLMVTPTRKDNRIWRITLGIYGVLIFTLFVLGVIDFGRIVVWIKEKKPNVWTKIQNKLVCCTKIPNWTKIQNKLVCCTNRNQAEQGLAA